MRKKFLKEHRPATYGRLLTSERLYPHLREVDEAAERRLEQAMLTMAAGRDPTDKATDPLKWAAEMNALRARAEELVRKELNYA
jgi:hypothetical protein